MRVDLFTPKTPPLFGLDITTSSVKMVELSRGRDGLRLERYAVEQSSENLLSEGGVIDHDALAGAIARCYAQLGTRLRHVALALPPQMMVTRKIRLPADLTPAELGSQVNTEAENYIPFPLAEVNLDYRIIGPSPGADGMIDVMVAAARREKVEERVSPVEAAGLRPLVVDAEAFAVQEIFERALALAGEDAVDRNHAVVDIGALSTRITVYRNGEQIYLREQRIGGDALTGDIMRRYEVSRHEAEVIKHGVRVQPDDYQTALLSPFVEAVAQEVQHALQLFITSTAYTSFDGIYITGGGATLQGLPEAVGRVASAPAQVLDTFAGISIDNFRGSPTAAQRLAGDAPLLATACSLALRRFD